MRASLSWFTVWIGGIVSLGASAAPISAPHPVLELRQYKIVPGQRDAFVSLFEREFIETQEALGMKLIGQYRDADDPGRFVWLREFTDMESRGKGLQAFYFGPVWKAHRDEANPMLDDNDNVLLLRPAGANGDFAASPPRARQGAAPTPSGLVVAHILYLWKDPEAGFSTFFGQKVRPALMQAGLPVLGAFVPETEPNNFPRLPVRQGEKVFVWFTRAADRAAYDRAWNKLNASAQWRDAIAGIYAGSQERVAQTLFLQPTARSALR